MSFPVCTYISQTMMHDQCGFVWYQYYNCLYRTHVTYDVPEIGQEDPRIGHEYLHSETLYNFGTTNCSKCIH